MPRVQTILASEQLEGPNFGDNAQADSFGALPGLGSVARGLSGVSAGLDTLDQRLRAQQKRRAGEDDERWVGDALYQERNHLNEWQSRPENNSGEDYAKNFRQYAESRMAEYEGKAPSPQAAQAFRSAMQSFVGSRFEGALLASERTRAENVKDSFINQTSLALGTFRGSGVTPNVSAVEELLESHLDIRSRIQKVYGVQDPIIGKKLTAYVDSEIALGLAHQDPIAAKDIVNTSTALEESAKLTLINKIESMESDKKSAGRDEFNRFRADYMVLVRDGKRKDPIPLSEYQQYFDADTSKKLKADDDQRQRIYTRANKHFSELAGVAPQAQVRALNEMRGKISGAEDDAVYSTLEARLREVQQLQQRDPVAWLSQYNDEVLESSRRLAATPQSPGVLSDRHFSVLRFQGPAPAGDPRPERYLDLPLLDRRLLTNAEVTKGRDYINQGSPAEAMTRIQEILATYPGQENQDMAFNDLAREPGGIRQEYRLAWQNKDQWWVQSFIAAIGDAKGLSALSDKQRGALADELDGNADWKSFQQYFVGPDPSRADQIAGFKQGIMSYANYFAASQGKGLRDSVRQSVEHLLKSTMGRTSMNGQQMWIVKERGPGFPDRTDEEIQDLGRRLDVSLRDLDPREVDQSKFSGLEAIDPRPDSLNRLQALRDQITRTGYFVPHNDGQYMILYVKGSAGIPFELRDKNNQAFMIKLDDLPNFATGISFGLDPTRTRVVRTEADIPGGVKTQPRDTYPLQEFPDSASLLNRTLDYWGGAYQKRTNWPTNSGYWRRKAHGDRQVPRAELDATPPRIKDVGPQLIK